MLEVTPEDFKNQFPRNFPYLPIWLDTKAYKRGAEVYYSIDDSFYLSLVDNNRSLPTEEEDWQTYDDTVDNYVTDEMIFNAIAEARFIFNESLFKAAEKTMAFLYLAAHFLVVDIRNIASGAGGAASFPEKIKRAGNVEVANAIPESMMNNPMLSGLLTTGYGQKYLMMVLPRSVGSIRLAKGWTTP